MGSSSRCVKLPKSFHSALCSRCQAAMVNCIFVLQTAIIGEADVLCTRDDDFYSPPAAELLERCRVTVLDDVSLLRRLRI